MNYMGNVSPLMGYLQQWKTLEQSFAGIKCRKIFYETSW
jgi:hypothetical protein